MKEIIFNRFLRNSFHLHSRKLQSIEKLPYDRKLARYPTVKSYFEYQRIKLNNKVRKNIHRNHEILNGHNHEIRSR